MHRRPRRNLVAAAGAAGVLVVAAARVLRNLGAYPAEVSARPRGAGLLPSHAYVSTRSVAIGAPAGEVWPWLVQMGYGRGGWYAIDALERAVGAGTLSARDIRPELQQLAVGDPVPLSGTVDLLVAELEPARRLKLTLQEGPLAWDWSFRLVPTTDGCRLTVRTAIAARRGWVRPLLPLLDIGHAVMELVQLHTIRRRAEGVRRPG